MTTNVPLLDLKAQFEAIKNEVVPAMMDVVESQAFIMGAPVQELETALANYCGAAEGIACASGTDALLLSLQSLDLQPGDEVITTPFTFFATAGAIHNAGGTAVFVDIDYVTFNLDPMQVAEAVTDRTRAIVPVHLFGQLAAMEPLLVIAERHDLAVIEDAAQAIGAKRKVSGGWKAAGSFGLTGAFSFFPSKNLGAWGDGGMIVTNDGARADRLRRLRTHGGAKQYHHDEIGTNSRLDTLQAAVLLRKLVHLDDWNAARRTRAARYETLFEDIEEVRTPQVDPANEHIFHQYTIRVPRRDDLRDHLKGNGIGCAVYYPKPLHLQPCFSRLGYRSGSMPESERACREVLSLPVHPELAEGQQVHVAEMIGVFYG